MTPSLYHKWTQKTRKIEEINFGMPYFLWYRSNPLIYTFTQIFSIQMLEANNECIVFKNIFHNITSQIKVFDCLCIWHNALLNCSKRIVISTIIYREGGFFCIDKCSRMGTKTSPWKFHHNLLGLDQKLVVDAICIFVHMYNLPYTESFLMCWN